MNKFVYIWFFLRIDSLGLINWVMDIKIIVKAQLMYC